MKIYLFNMTNPNFVKELSLLSTDEENRKKNISKSYSNEVMAVCISDEMPIGIDLEKRVERSPETINHFMDKFTTFQIKNKPMKVDEEWFYKAWTAMESYFKLIGDGFGTPKDFILDLEEKCIWREERKVAWLKHVVIGDFILCLCTNQVLFKEELQMINKNSLEK